MLVSADGTAQVQPRNAEARSVTVDSQLSARLFQDLNTIGSLSALPRTHCMKSVSFGSSLYVEFDGERSPDLSCPAPANSNIATLKKDVQDLMNAAGASKNITKKPN